MTLSWSRSEIISTVIVISRDGRSYAWKLFFVLDPRQVASDLVFPLCRDTAFGSFLTHENTSPLDVACPVGLKPSPTWAFSCFSTEVAVLRGEGTVQEASDVTGLFVRVEESSRTAQSLGTVLAEQHLLDG